MRWLPLLGILAFACSTPATTPLAPATTLHAESGPTNLADLTSRKPLTVVLFFTSECPVQKAHDARFREIVSKYEPKGVAFVGVIAEAHANVLAEREDAQRRGLSIPMLEDKNAGLADALGVEFSTHVVILDRERRILYSGAVDSDRSHLTPSAERHLENALDDALAGRSVRKSKTEALGCPLRKH